MRAWSHLSNLSLISLPHQSVVGCLRQSYRVDIRAITSLNFFFILLDSASNLEIQK